MKSSPISKKKLALLSVLLWSTALFFSSIVRRDQAIAIPTDHELFEIPWVGSKAGQPSGQISLAYRLLNPNAPLPPLVLIHGSPGSGEDFSRLHPLLKDRPLLIPDLPGFAHSRQPIPNYSSASHALYLDALLTHLNLEKVHLLGFSLGGAVALELEALRPGTVESITLLSSVGVQELELLGDYSLNHLIHGAQLAAITLVTEIVPHFGLLDRFPLNIPYARNFFDTDQRPLRGRLLELEAPTLIIHGKSDPLVPLAAAIEHHRLVPQSKLVVFDTDHFFLFTDPTEAAAGLKEFLARVDQGEAHSRLDASPERLADSQQVFDAASLPKLSGFSLWVVVLLLAIATLVSEDLTCIGAGILVADGRIGFPVAFWGCFLGILVGDLLLFLAGRWLGRPALRVPPLAWWIRESSVERSSQWFRNRVFWVIGLSRFTPGARLPTYFAAGVLRTSFWRFLLYFTLACAIWTPLLVLFSAHVGRQALGRLEHYQGGLGLALLAVFGFYWVLRRLIIPLFSFRGRRRLRGAWNRWTQWEFWPRSMVYLPLLPYFILLAFRYRSPTAFTTSNPAIPHGGFVGESKSDILQGLGTHRVAPWIRVPPGAKDGRWRAVQEFQETICPTSPLVLKPDVGERGHGVSIVRSASEARTWIGQQPKTFIAQRYIPGIEVGVFWTHHPEEDHGKIISVTHKVTPQVVGDGRSTIGDLILRDPRAVALASVYLKNLGKDSDRIPDSEEVVPLGELGTHSRGSIFLDGAHLLTPALEAEVEALGQGFEGFHFGRFDLRASSIKALQKGEFSVIELNGVTSECTHIYDPRYSVFYGWRTLRQQWAKAFEIGQAVGGKPTSVVQLLNIAFRRITPQLNNRS